MNAAIGSALLDLLWPTVAALYSLIMGKRNKQEREVRFVLVPDPQALIRLLPVVSTLALSQPVEKERVDIHEEPEDSDALNH